MNDKYDYRADDLDFYSLYLRRYLSEHRFPEAEDDLLIAARADHAYDVFVASRLDGDEWYIANEKAMAALYQGFEMSQYDFVSDILTEEFFNHISLDHRSIEFWTYTLMGELSDEFKGVELTSDFLNSTDGTVFRLGVIGRITLFFEKYGL